MYIVKSFMSVILHKTKKEKYNQKNDYVCKKKGRKKLILR